MEGRIRSAPEGGRDVRKCESRRNGRPDGVDGKQQAGIEGRGRCFYVILQGFPGEAEIEEQDQHGDAGQDVACERSIHLQFHITDSRGAGTDR